MDEEPTIEETAEDGQEIRVEDLRKKHVVGLLSLKESDLAVEYDPKSMPAYSSLDDFMEKLHAAISESSICDWDSGECVYHDPSTNATTVRQKPSKPKQGIHCLALRRVKLGQKACLALKGCEDPKLGVLYFHGCPVRVLLDIIRNGFRPRVPSEIC